MPIPILTTPGHKATSARPKTQRPPAPYGLNNFGQSHSPIEDFDTEKDPLLQKFRATRTPTGQQRPLSALKTRTTKPHKNAATPNGYPPEKQGFYRKLADSLLPAPHLPPLSTTARTLSALTEQTDPPARPLSAMHRRPTSAVTGHQHVNPTLEGTPAAEIVAAQPPSCLATGSPACGTGYRLTRK